MKRLISIALVFFMLATVFNISFTANATDNATTEISTTSSQKVFGDYTYEVLENGTAQLNKYKGADLNLALPSTIDGYTVSAIDEYIFSEYNDFETITIPDSITSVNYGSFSSFAGVFADCQNLTNIYVDKNNKSFCSVDGVFYDKSMETIICYPPMKEGTEYAIPNGVKSIFKSAFQCNQYLHKVTIPESVLEIGESAFWMCENLTEVNIPDSVTYIMFNAFSYTAIKKIVLGDSVQLIGEWAFDGCSQLEEVHIPASVVRIESNVFDGCSSLKSITVDENNPVFYEESGVLFTKDKTELILFTPNNSIKEYTVPNVVTKIRASAFSGCKNLTNVIMSDNITYIGDSAFSFCRSLNYIQLPSNIEKISESCFMGCTNLEDIQIPNNVKIIEDWAFNSCESLKIIDVPNGVTSIGGCAFAECTNLYKVSIPDSLTSIYSGAFMSCSQLKSITIPSTVTTIENMSLGYEYDCEYLGANFTIYGEKGSAAEEYATKYGLNFSTETEPEPVDPYFNKVLLGDADGSRTVNIKDATMIQKFLASLIELEKNSKFAANVIVSDSLNIKDATAIQKWIAGIETGCNIGEAVDITNYN